MALRGVRILAVISGVDCAVWPRNSFVTEALEPGFSDIDLTVFYQSSLLDQNRERFLSRVNQFRRFWPFLGEINFYSAEVSEFSYKFHNSFELLRDPELVARCSRKLDQTMQLKQPEQTTQPKLGESKRSPDLIEGSVFLLRQLEQDLNNLTEIPKKRLKKWLRHYDDLYHALSGAGFGRKTEFKSFVCIDEVIETIVTTAKCWNPVMIRDLSEKLTFHLHLQRHRVNCLSLGLLFKMDAWFFVWNAQRLGGRYVEPLIFNEGQVRFLIYQMRWEICGILCQAFTVRQKQEARVYLSDLLLMVKQVDQRRDHPDFPELFIQFEEALSLLEGDRLGSRQRGAN
jgi:hypothetical protein